MPLHIKHNEVEEEGFNVAKNNLMYTWTVLHVKNSLHVLCRPCTIIMLYLNNLYASVGINLSNFIFVTLQASNSMRDVARVMLHKLERRDYPIFKLVTVVDHKCSQMHMREYVSKLLY